MIYRFPPLFVALLKNDLLTIRALVCMVLVELAITCVHDFMVVTVTVTKINGKMNFNRWTLAITAVPTTLTSRFLITYARVL